LRIVVYMTDIILILLIIFAIILALLAAHYGQAVYGGYRIIPVKNPKADESIEYLDDVTLEKSKYNPLGRLYKTEASNGQIGQILANGQNDDIIRLIQLIIRNNGGLEVIYRAVELLRAYKGDDELLGQLGNRSIHFDVNIAPLLSIFGNSCDNILYIQGHSGAKQRPLGCKNITYMAIDDIVYPMKYDDGHFDFIVFDMALHHMNLVDGPSNTTQAHMANMNEFGRILAMYGVMIIVDYDVWDALDQMLVEFGHKMAGLSTSLTCRNYYGWDDLFIHQLGLKFYKSDYAYDTEKNVKSPLKVYYAVYKKTD
jgi:hypothetical protein